MPETSSAMSAYSVMKGDLVRCIDEMLAMECIRGCTCVELREKIETNAFNLVVVGQFKRGKTSLINALLGADILPVAVVPLTSIATVMTYGDALRIKVYFNDGNVRQAFNIWRAIEDDKLARAFEAICKRFVVKINEAVDTLLKFSSDLFEIAFEASKTEALWSTRSRFYYKFKEQPGGIEIVASSYLKV